MKENIEEDIKRISNLIDYVENADYVDASQCIDSEDIQAIEHILSDYKRVLKENEELLEIRISAGAHNRIIELQKENLRLRYQDIPYLEGEIKGYKTRIEELKYKYDRALEDLCRKRCK